MKKIEKLFPIYNYGAWRLILKFTKTRDVILMEIFKEKLKKEEANPEEYIKLLKALGIIEIQKVRGEEIVKFKADVNTLEKLKSIWTCLLERVESKRRQFFQRYCDYVEKLKNIEKELNFYLENEKNLDKIDELFLKLDKLEKEYIGEMEKTLGKLNEERKCIKDKKAKMEELLMKFEIWHELPEEMVLKSNINQTKTIREILEKLERELKVYNQAYPKLSGKIEDLLTYLQTLKTSAKEEEERAEDLLSDYQKIKGKVKEAGEKLLTAIKTLMDNTDSLLKRVKELENALKFEWSTSKKEIENLKSEIQSAGYSMFRDFYIRMKDFMHVRNVFLAGLRSVSLFGTEMWAISNLPEEKFFWPSADCLMLPKMEKKTTSFLDIIKKFLSKEKSKLKHEAS